jgi:hypothetical protein
MIGANHHHIHRYEPYHRTKTVALEAEQSRLRKILPASSPLLLQRGAPSGLYPQLFDLERDRGIIIEKYLFLN